MSRSIRIIDLNGKMLACIKGQDQTWSQVVQRSGIPSRFSYCQRHWMSEGDVESAAEKNTKSFLDRVGYILIQDAPDDGILNDYKEMRDRVATYPASMCAVADDIMYGTTRSSEEGRGIAESDVEAMTKSERAVYESLTRPRKIPDSVIRIREKRRRIDQMRADNPLAQISFCVVDRSNEFSYLGQTYRIHESVKQYAGVSVKDDVLYDMDRIVVADTQGRLRFYDQEYNALSDEEVGIV